MFPGWFAITRIFLFNVYLYVALLLEGSSHLASG